MKVKVLANFGVVLGEGCGASLPENHAGCQRARDLSSKKTQIGVIIKQKVCQHSLDNECLVNLYAHLVLARAVESILCPTDPAEYYWGAIIPDIRYMAGMPRSQTHLPLEEIDRLMHRYTHLRDFLIGFRVHCLVDKIDVGAAVGEQFPLSLVRARFSPQMLTMMTEYYYLRTGRFAQLVSGKYNDALIELGIEPDQCAAFAGAANQYIASPTFETALQAFESLGMVDNRRINRYIKNARRIESSLLIKPVLLWSVRRARLEQLAQEIVQRHPAPQIPITAPRPLPPLPPNNHNKIHKL